MELVLTTQDLEPLPSSKKRITKRTNYGILNTSYKCMARENYKRTNDNHLFSVRARVKSERFRITTPSPDALIKFVLFTALILLTPLF